jgi:ComF family protein
MKPSGLIDIVFPSRCALCEASGPNLCEQCRFVLTPMPHRFQRGPISGLAATTYSSEISKLLVAFKDKGQFALVRELKILMSPLALEIAAYPEPVVLIPAPSRSQNFARRGFTPSLLLARALANAVPNTKVASALILDLKVQDQVGLTSKARQANLAGSMRLNQSLAGRACFIVDDVVTTGATVTEAFRALSLGGAQVVGALVVSEAKNAPEPLN